MSESPALTLLYQQALAFSPQNIAIINAHAHPLLSDMQQQHPKVNCQQWFKPESNALAHLGLDSSPLTGLYDRILIIPSKDKVQTLGWMALAFEHLVEHGQCHVACENKHGAKSYETALKQLALHVNSTSKAKCRLFSASKTSDLVTSLQQTWLAASRVQRLPSHHLWTQAGIFSWKQADLGSALLLQHLPHTLTGSGMDLCCGYALLTADILENSPHIKTLHLVEADALALACAQQNTATTQHSTQLCYHHVDASCESLPKHLDWVVCNPPFHRGHVRDVALGQSIVRRACHALKHGGELYLVANRQLPYEKLLAEQLSHVEIRAVGDGFKIIYGKR